MPRRMLAATAILLALPALAGCMFLPSAAPPEPTSEPSNEQPVSVGPEGWTEFPSCPAGPQQAWVWVDGFPAEELEASGIVPLCADTWIQDDDDHFTGVVARELRFEQFDALSEEMVAAGWDVTYDDLVDAPAGTAPGPVGWRDYSLDGGDTVFIIEAYYDGDAAGYTVYADLHSPGTRALAP